MTQRLSMVPPIDRESVHVWKVQLDLPAAVLDEMHATLSRDEQVRAQRFRFDRDRNRFVAARGTLRLLLARYRDAAPAAIRFHYGAYGKPLLADDDRLRFNTTHSGGLALIAITAHREIGVDIEQRTGGVEYLAIAEQFFASDEVAALKSLPVGQRQDGFLNGWTRKEAYIKARGEGLSLPLDDFAVSLKPDEAPALRWTAAGAEETDRWDVRAIAIGAEYVAALVIERPCGETLVFSL